MTSESRHLSPLIEIERAVQERAKASADEPDSGSRAHIRALVQTEVDAWDDAYKRGNRSAPLADAPRVADRAVRNLAGYGPLEPLLDDDDVWEICINAPDQIFVKRHSGPTGYHDENFHDEAHVVRTLTRILDEASGAHRKFDPAEGLQDAQLKTGARLHIVHSDIGSGGFTIVNIRKFTGVAIRSLEELVRRDMLSAETAAFLRACIQARLTVVFAGPPASGKTTLMSCCAAELDPALRVVVAEEVYEADVPLPNVASMQTRPARPDREAIDLRRLVSGFLRMAPDVAIVGEVRDREALPLLLTLSSGVCGYTTIHAGSARQALTRLRFISQLAGTSSDIPLPALSSLVSDAIDIVVHSDRRTGRVQVTEVIAVEALQGGADSVSFTTTQIFERDAACGELLWSGLVPVRAERALASVGYDVRRLVHSEKKRAT